MTRLKNKKYHFKNGKYGTTQFQETFWIPQLEWNILLWYDQTREREFGCFYIMLIHKNHFKKQKYGTESV